MIINTLYEPRWDGKMSAGSDLHIRWREEIDGSWVRKEKRVTDFRPYGYVLRGSHHFVTGRDGIARTVPTNLLSEQKNLWMVDGMEQSDKVSPKGHALDKIYFKNSAGMRSFTYSVRSNTFECEVPYEDRYLIDRVDEVPNYKMRKLFIDLEALQYHRDSHGPPAGYKNKNNSRDFQQINVIGVYDSFTKTRTQWCQYSTYEEQTKVLQFDDNQVIVHYFSDEKSMLQSFVDYVDAADPDCMLAWGMGFYDGPSLYCRLEACGIGADKLSPSSLGDKRHMMAPTHKGNQYRWTAQPIIGRLLISQDVLFERIYKDSKSATLPSNKLDIVGQKLFGRGKTDFRPDFYDENYDEFMEKYLYYNYRDVELMVEIEEKYNLVEGQQSLQQVVKCQFNSTFYGSSFARVYFMRKANFIQKTGWQETYDAELEGAIVFDPEELDTIGLHKNTVILDFAGLYPSMIIAYNTSFETKVAPGEEQDDDIIGDGCRFRRSPEGVLPTCVKELDVLRDHYKDLRQEAAKEQGKGSDDYRKWDDAQKTVKRLRATFYGLMGFGRHGYAWGDIDIARTITHGGRTALLQIKGECEKMGYEVIYGHTDSIFVKLGDDKSIEECAEIAEYLGKKLTEVCQATLKSEAVVVEPEMIMDRFYLPRRNRYAGRIVWQPGTGESPFDIANEPVDDRIKMIGLEAKHTNTAPVGRTAQVEAIKMIWDDTDPQEILAFLQGLVSKVRNGEVPDEDLIARARLGKWLTNFSDKMVPRSDGKRMPIHHPLCDSTKPYEWEVKGKTKNCKCRSWTGVGSHYVAGSTNERAHPGARDETDQCYGKLDGAKRAAAWHNVVLSDELYPKLDRGDSFAYTFAKSGPTWIPEGGYVAFHELSQIGEYELDLEMIIEKNIINKLDHVLYGIGLSNDMLRPKSKYQGRQLSLEDFQ